MKIYIDKQPKPWISAAIMVLIFTPHLIWLIQHDWLPFSYASGRSSESIGDSPIAAHFGWVGFLLAQLVAHLPLIIMLLLTRKHLSFKNPNYSDAKLFTESVSNPIASENTNGLSDTDLPISTANNQSNLGNIRLVWYMWFAPILLLIALSLIFGIGLRDMWGMPMWSLSGLLSASLIKPESLVLLKNKLPRYIMFWLTFVSALMIIYLQFGHTIRKKPSRMDWPEQQLSLEAQREFLSYKVKISSLVNSSSILRAK